MSKTVTPMLSHATVATFSGRMIALVGDDAALAVDNDGGTLALAIITVESLYRKALAIAGRIVGCPFSKKSNEL